MDSPTTTLTPDLIDSPGLRKYNMYYTASMLNVTIHEGKSSDPALYYMESKLSFRKPRLLLRRGATGTASKSSPVVAFVKGRNTSRNMVIGLGDCEDKEHADDVTFEDLSRDKNTFRRSDYRFSTELDGDGDGKQTELVWRKDMTKCGKTVYDCVDEHGTLVARLLSGGAFNWKKGGEIHLADSLGQGLKDLLVVSALGIWTLEAFCYQSQLQGF